MNLRYKFFCAFFSIIFCTIPTISFADDFFEYNISDSSLLEVFSQDADKNIPSINARHAVVLDRNSGTVLYGKNENEQCKMASTTKILTAIVVIENSPDLSAIVTVSSKAAHTGGSRLGLSTDDKISVYDLLYGLLMVSGNDAAVALAEFTSNDINSFSILMNQKANELGLTSSHFITPHGLDQEEHYTTAFELAKIADYALHNQTFAEIVRTSNYTITINNNSKNLHNTNELLGTLEGVYGVKTGFTNGANRCLVTSCKKGNLDIICVVLGCDTKKDRTQDSVKLIKYIFNNFSVVDLCSIINNYFNTWLKNDANKINVEKSTSSDLILGLDTSQIKFNNVAINNDCLENIDISINFANNFTAPLPENYVIGSLIVNINDSNCFSVDIVNKNLVERKSIFYYINGFFKSYFSYFDL